MTTREAYVFGWMFGFIIYVSKDNNIGGDPVLASQRPYSASAKIISEANRKGLLAGEVDRQIAEAMSEIQSFPDSQPEPFLSLELQGCWQRGYFSGKSGNSLVQEQFNIRAARRLKGMTQAQLAKSLDVRQEQVSRWETGKVFPNEDNLKKIKKVLS